MKVVAIIVTYNRLPLLKKCVEAVIAQSRKPDEVIVINNGSTDDTQSWLSGQAVNSFTQENRGGAGGFATGIKLAYQHGADWIWLMDDDTIPNYEALEQLESTLNDHVTDNEKIGFLSSRVYWTDGSLHEMNRTYQLKDPNKLAKVALSHRTDLQFIQFGTFVSMLLSAKAVERIGLPIREFFIWTDDIEYSKRIIGNGLAGILVDSSTATHETPINNMSSVFKDDQMHLWKYRYGLRNEMYTKRMHDGKLQFWITWVHRMFIMPIRIAFNRKSHRWAFIKVIWMTSLEALFFKPKIEMVHERLNG